MKIEELLELQEKGELPVKISRIETGQLVEVTACNEEYLLVDGDDYIDALCLSGFEFYKEPKEIIPVLPVDSANIERFSVVKNNTTRKYEVHALYLGNKNNLMEGKIATVEEAKEIAQRYTELARRERIEDATVFITSYRV